MRLFHLILTRLTTTKGRAFLLIGSGLLSALAFPPFGLLFFLPPALMVFLAVVSRAKTAKQASWSGWFYGLGFFTLSLYWVGEAFLVDSARHGGLMPFALLALCSGMALFFMGVSVLTWGLKALFRLDDLSVLFAFAGCWILFEWLRSWVLTGFPWNLMGQVWVAVPEILQFGSVFGVWGLSAVTVLAFSVPWVFLYSCFVRRSFGLELGVFVLLWGAFGVIYLWGGLRLETAPTGPDAFHQKIVRVVQPNILQREKWVPELRRGHLVNQIALSIEGQKPDLVIWPETAVPYVLAHNSTLKQFVARAVPESGYLLTGAPRYELRRGAVDSERFYNSLYILNRKGDILDSYDKAHLVPFGEYTPWGLGKLTSFGQGNFTPGPGPQTLSAPGIPAFSPLICYEIIFPGAVVAQTNRPQWLLNITNDAWFGRSSGPWQHLSMSQLRAVEEGLPVLRAANTGISAAIDGYGRILQHYPLSERGYFDQKLPRPVDQRTIFSVVGNYSVALLVIILACCVTVLHKLRGGSRERIPS